jgi:hypothetical protein
MLADHVRYLRFRRSLKLMDRARAVLEARGVEPNAVPHRVLVPLLEAGSLEDDPDMSERWAQLLASAAEDPNVVAPSFPEVLRQLEPVEARLLDQLVATRPVRHNMPMTTLELEQVPGHEPIEWRHLDNLERLGLISYRTTLPQNVTIPDQPTGVILIDTSFGAELVKACGNPGEPRPPTPKRLS